MAHITKTEERRQTIRELISRDGSVRVGELSKELGVTAVTIRSDLAALEEEGFLQRMNGGAIMTIRNIYQMDFAHRRKINIELKKKIAVKAAQMIEDYSTILINSGTTAFLTAVELKKRTNLNIVTNSLEIALEMGQQPTFRVVLLGGDINSQYAFTFGNTAIEQLSQYKASYAILSMDGVNADGLTTFHGEEAVVDSAMIDRSRKTIVVADSTKLGFEGFSFVEKLSDNCTLVTDEAADPEILSSITAAGTRVVMA